MPFKYYPNNIFINTTTQESYLTLSAYAAMIGKRESTLIKRIEAEDPASLIEIPQYTEDGVQYVFVVNEEYLAKHLPYDNAPLTSDVLKMGVRSYLHLKAGYSSNKGQSGVNLNQRPINRTVWLTSRELAEEKMGYSVDSHLAKCLDYYLCQMAKKYKLDRRAKTKEIDGFSKSCWIFKDSSLVRDFIEDFFNNK